MITLRIILYAVCYNSFLMALFNVRWLSSESYLGNPVVLQLFILRGNGKCRIYFKSSPCTNLMVGVSSRNLVKKIVLYKSVWRNSTLFVIRFSSKSDIIDSTLLHNVIINCLASSTVIWSKK